MCRSFTPEESGDHTKKKQKIYAEQDEEQRQRFAEEVAKVAKVAKEDLVWLDKSGMDNRIHQEHGRSPRGEKLFARVPGGRKQRVSIIAALCGKRILAPLMLSGSCNRQLFNDWVETRLAPELDPGKAVVLDNASFHKSARTVELIEVAGCRVLFLPPCSPDCNPIEHFWHTQKSAVKKLLPACGDIPSAIAAFFNPVLTST